MYQESTSVTFEWTLDDLKNLFESTKGESKSKVTKSVRFGGGRWQILFYANSGTDGGGFVSLYLSCEPTTEEKDRALDARWIREGVFKFSFELRSTTKTVLYNSKEAHNHTFSWKTANWGWAQFARRDNVYFHSSAVKEPDAFVIICTITSAAMPPAPTCETPSQFVPKDLLETIGSLLGDATYSDVEFVFPRRGRGSHKNPRRIFANRKIIERAEYFKAMFSSGFAETSDYQAASADNMQFDAEDNISEAGSFASSKLTRYFEDSDDEEDEFQDDDDPEGVISDTASNSQPARLLPRNDSFTSLASSPSKGSVDDSTAHSDNETETEGRNVRAKLSHMSSPSGGAPVEAGLDSTKEAASHTPSRLHVVVKDVAYITYRAVLYYLYTDTIVFAPLSSSFNSSSQAAMSSSLSLPNQLLSESQNITGTVKGAPQSSAPVPKRSDSRRSWVADWQNNNPGRPTPCSAKAAYRIADKLGLNELKERAYQHIEKSLTVQNIAFEVFSPFSAAFEDIRKVQVAFFLEHWSDIRASDAMGKVWLEIRSGRHPGFEEVWPVIAQHLEFRPQLGGNSTSNPEP